MSFRIKITGDKALIKKLQNLAEKHAKQAIRTATTKAVRKLRAAVKAQVPKDKGDLRKSIDFKVCGKGYRITGIVGSNIAQHRVKSGKDEVVARELHLVEFGFQHTGGETVAGQFPLTKGAEQSRRECESTYETILRQEIDKAAAGGKK